MSVVITVGDATPAVCTPTVASGAGCTVVSVPPLGAGVVRLVPTTSVIDVVERHDRRTHRGTVGGAVRGASPDRGTQPVADRGHLAFPDDLGPDRL